MPTTPLSLFFHRPAGTPGPRSDWRSTVVATPVAGLHRQAVETRADRRAAAVSQSGATALSEDGKVGQVSRAVGLTGPNCAPQV